MRERSESTDNEKANAVTRSETIVSREEMEGVLSDAIAELQYHNEIHHPEDVDFTDRTYQAILERIRDTVKL